ncbi:MAG: flagellar hook-basal body complex protein, partial [Gallionella sp.]|nr:flagellar hook-basal body complex protein [Gallionella sp.]
VAAVAQQFTQGNITNTNNPLDTAIGGQGFFRMTDAAGAISYSRNGQFQVDKNGFVVNNQAHKVSGYLPDATGVIFPAAPVPLQINAADLTPKQTLNAVVGANLDSRAAVPLIPAFNALDPTSYNSSTSLTVYDSLGASHVGSLYFQRQPITQPTFTSATTTTATVSSVAGLAVGNTLTFALPAPAQTATISAINAVTNTVTFAALAAAPTGGPITTNAPSASWKTFLTVDGVAVPGTATPELATLSFDALGKLASTFPATVPIGKVTSAALFPTSTTVSPTQALTFDFGSPTAGTSQYGGNFGVNTLTQDGYTSGRLNSISTSADGTILGRYSNGQSRALG